jgi:multicomponent Na+:H+ antiporter subunit B
VRNAVTLLAMLILGAMLLVVAGGMPPFGDPGAPVQNALPERFTGSVLTETGAANSVAAVVLDYRGYDTLGEATVLFTAVSAAMAALAAMAEKGGKSGG